MSTRDYSDCRDDLPADVYAILTGDDFPVLSDDQYHKLGAWLYTYRRKEYGALDNASLARSRCLEAAKKRLKPIYEFNTRLRSDAERPSVVDARPRWESIAKIEENVKKFAPTDCSILLLGETGTGKEFYARRIHEGSRRKMKPFEPVNCATLPKGLIDAELYGYKKGAFTSAAQDYQGKIREAAGGTLFLDEIGDLPSDCWGNLLRFLQDGEIAPLGSKNMKVDVRILAATNKPGSIPPEARHRFDHEICLPPLRERKEDIPGLAKELFNAVKRKVRNKKSLRFTASEAAALARAPYQWPGNIRQLQKAIERAVILHDSGRELTAQEVIKAAESAAT
jgi:transcriptional regulator with PAS, ATPase and Fis domain